MTSAPYDPNVKLQVHIVSQSPHTFAYKLFVAQKGDKEWTRLDEGTIETLECEYGPYASGTLFAYTLLVAGNPRTDWRIQVMLSQHGTLVAGSPNAETGFTNASGVARRDAAVVLGQG